MIFGRGPIDGFEIVVEGGSVLSPDADQSVAHFMDDAALVGDAQKLTDGGADGFVIVGNRERIDEAFVQRFRMTISWVYFLLFVRLLFLNNISLHRKGIYTH